MRAQRHSDLRVPLAMLTASLVVILVACDSASTVTHGDDSYPVVVDPMSPAYGGLVPGEEEDPVEVANTEELVASALEMFESDIADEHVTVDENAACYLGGEVSDEFYEDPVIGVEGQVWCGPVQRRTGDGNWDIYYLDLAQSEDADEFEFQVADVPREVSIAPWDGLLLVDPSEAQSPPAVSLEEPEPRFLADGTPVQNVEEVIDTAELEFWSAAESAHATVSEDPGCYVPVLENDDGEYDVQMDVWCGPIAQRDVVVPWQLYGLESDSGALSLSGDSREASQQDVVVSAASEDTDDGEAGLDDSDDGELDGEDDGVSELVDISAMMALDADGLTSMPHEDLAVPGELLDPGEDRLVATDLPADASAPEGEGTLNGLSYGLAIRELYVGDELGSGEQGMVADDGDVLVAARLDIDQGGDSGEHDLEANLVVDDAATSWDGWDDLVGPDDPLDPESDENGHTVVASVEDGVEDVELEIIEAGRSQRLSLMTGERSGDIPSVLYRGDAAVNLAASARSEADVATDDEDEESDIVTVDTVLGEAALSAYDENNGGWADSDMAWLSVEVAQLDLDHTGDDWDNRAEVLVDESFGMVVHDEAAGEDIEYAVASDFTADTGFDSESDDVVFQVPEDFTYGVLEINPTIEVTGGSWITDVVSSEETEEVGVEIPE